MKTFGYSESCGGCSVLHLLVHLMNTESNPSTVPIAYLSGGNPHTNPKYITPIVPSWFNRSNSIAIYNENPQNLFNATMKIYYILFFPRNGVTYPKGSYILCWSVGYCEAIDNSMKKFTLNLLQLDMQLFHGVNRDKERTATYILIKKNVWMISGNVVTINDTVDFSLGKPFPIMADKKERLKLLVEAKRLVSYDRATFISVEAAAMGCLSIVMPIPNITRQTWLRSVGDAFRYGIAYGFEEIDYAMSTMDQVNSHLRSLATKQGDNVQEFLKDAINFFRVHQ